MGAQEESIRSSAIVRTDRQWHKDHNIRTNKDDKQLSEKITRKRKISLVEEFLWQNEFDRRHKTKQQTSLYIVY